MRAERSIENLASSSFPLSSFPPPPLPCHHPQVYVGKDINAGLYIFNPEILDRIEVRGFHLAVAARTLGCPICPPLASPAHILPRALSFRCGRRPSRRRFSPRWQRRASCTP